MSINAIIVDDEEYCRKSLFFLIEGYCPNIRVKGIAKSVAEARSFLKAQKIDLVFLDIAMPTEDGFGLLPDLQKNMIAVIFTTAYDKYALKAMKASAVDYLLKPIDIEELQSSAEKAFVWKTFKENHKSHDGSYSSWLNSLAENLNERKEIKKINLPYTNGFHLLETSSILYIEADNNYSIFHLQNGERIVVSKPLKDYEEVLEDSGFNRIHKSTLINLRHLTDYSKKDGLTVTLSDRSEHTVSRRRASDFLETVRQLFKR